MSLLRTASATLALCALACAAAWGQESLPASAPDTGPAPLPAVDRDAGEASLVRAFQKEFAFLANEERKHKAELEAIYYQVIHSGGV